MGQNDISNNYQAQKMKNQGAVNTAVGGGINTMFQSMEGVHLGSDHSAVGRGFLALVFGIAKRIITIFGAVVLIPFKFMILSIIVRTTIDTPLEYLFSYLFHQNSPVILPLNPFIVLSAPLVFPISVFFMFLASFRIEAGLRFLFMTKPMVVFFTVIHFCVFFHCFVTGVAWDFMHDIHVDETTYFIFSIFGTIGFSILYMLQPYLYNETTNRMKGSNNLNALNEQSGGFMETVLGHNNLQSKIGGFRE